VENKVAGGRSSPRLRWRITRDHKDFSYEYTEALRRQAESFGAVLVNAAAEDFDFLASPKTFRLQGEVIRPILLSLQMVRTP
jgi:hypothetical protein